MWKAKIMRNITERDLGRLLTINEKFYKVFFFVTDTGYGNFLLSSYFYEGDSK